MFGMWGVLGAGGWREGSIVGMRGGCVAGRIYGSAPRSLVVWWVRHALCWLGDPRMGGGGLEGSSIGRGVLECERCEEER